MILMIILAIYLASCFAIAIDMELPMLSVMSGIAIIAFAVLCEYYVIL